MPKLKLSPIEIQTLKGFISKYENFTSELQRIQTKLEGLDQEKHDLMEVVKNLAKQLEKVREEEDENTKILVAKYGEFELNLETFDIETT